MVLEEATTGKSSGINSKGLSEATETLSKAEISLDFPYRSHCPMATLQQNRKRLLFPRDWNKRV